MQMDFMQRRARGLESPKIVPMCSAVSESN